MALTVATNTGALMAQAAASSVNKEMETSMQRLSTGLRINSAADDAAGTAIVSKLDAQIRGIGQAIRNAGDAQNMIDTAEAAHQEVTNVLQRMRELAVQATTDTYTSQDRASLQLEVNQLISEIDRISAQTTFNGMALLNGTFTNKSFQIGADANQTITASISSVATASIGSHTKEFVGALKIDTADAGTTPNSGGQTLTLTGSQGTSTVTIGANKTAKEVAAAVNDKTKDTGVSATAVTHLKISANPANTGGGATPNVVSGGATVTLNVNGTAISSSLITETDLRTLRDSINAISGTTGVTAKMGSSNADIILTDLDGDNIELDNFVTGDDDTILFVATLKADGSTEAGTVAADATDEVGHVGVLKDDSVSSAAFGMVSVSGSLSFTDVSAFTVGGGSTSDALAAGDTTHFHVKGASAGVSSDMSTIGAVNIGTQAGATAAIQAADGALQGIARARATLGALSNRLDNTISNLTSVSNASNETLSGIQDADFASETTNLAKTQILQQASTAMLAQANASKQNVLSLLQG